MTYGYPSTYAEWAKAEARVLDAERELLKKIRSSPPNTDLAPETLKLDELRLKASMLLKQFIDAADDAVHHAEATRQSLDALSGRARQMVEQQIILEDPFKGALGVRGRQQHG